MLAQFQMMGIVRLPCVKSSFVLCVKSVCVLVLLLFCQIEYLAILHLEKLVNNTVYSSFLFFFFLVL